MGIIGGCMSHQDGMPISHLYHKRLAVVLARDHGITLCVRIRRDFYAPYDRRLELLRVRVAIPWMQQALASRVFN